METEPRRRYAQVLVQAAVLRRMKEVRRRVPKKLQQGCFVQLHGVPDRWFEKGYREWTDAPRDLLARLPRPK